MIGSQRGLLHLARPNSYRRRPKRRSWGASHPTSKADADDSSPAGKHTEDTAIPMAHNTRPSRKPEDAGNACANEF
jgi:hypothetical protein